MDRMRQRARTVRRWLGYTFAPIFLAGVMVGVFHEDIGDWSKNKLSTVFNSNTGQAQAATSHIRTKAPTKQLMPDSAGPSSTLAPAWTSSAQPKEKKSEQQKNVKKNDRLLTSLTSIFSSDDQPDYKYKWSKKELLAKIEYHTKNDPIPNSVIKQLIKSESAFKTKAKSKEGARGLGQFMPQTQLEYLYKCQDILPSYAAELAEHIKPNNKKLGYHITKNGDAKAIWKLIEDPDVSIIMTREYVREGIIKVDKGFRDKVAGLIRYLKKKGDDKSRIKALKKHLKRPLTPADVKIAHVLGHNGAINFLTAHADPAKKDFKASDPDYADPSAVRGNPGLFKKNGKPRSVENFYKNMERIMGDKTPLPRSLKRPAAEKTAMNKTPLPPGQDLT